MRLWVQLFQLIIFVDQGSQWVFSKFYLNATIKYIKLNFIPKQSAVKSFWEAIFSSDSSNPFLSFLLQPLW